MWLDHSTSLAACTISSQGVRRPFAQRSAVDVESHVFIVRIWLEPREIAGAALEWRAVIEHVPDGKQRYVNDLDQLEQFISPYLEEAGVRLGARWRARRWLSRLRRTQRKQS
jgi:hypothetical protein